MEGAGRGRAAGRLSRREFRRGTGAGRLSSHVATPATTAKWSTLPNWPARPLESYAAVCLFDPPPLVENTWRQLADYARGGGGLGIFLGANVEQQFACFNTEAAQELLPGPLEFIARFPEGTNYLSSKNDQHPIMAKFRCAAARSPGKIFRCIASGSSPSCKTAWHRGVDGRRPAGAVGKAARQGTRADARHAGLGVGRSARRRPLESIVGRRSVALLHAHQRGGACTSSAAATSG